MPVSIRSVGPLLAALALMALVASPVDAGSLDDMISPVTSPTLNEDPRCDTEIRPMFLYTNIHEDFLTKGGSYSVLAVQARLAITDRLALIATKDGYVWWSPDEALTEEDGWANVAFGVKGALWRDDEHAFVLTGGMRYETRWGSRDVFMGRGDGLLNPFLSMAKGFGDFHAQLYSGPRIAISGNDTSFWDINAHFDYKLGPIYPLIEWNIGHGLDGGRRYPIAQEGFDLVDLGSRYAGGETVATLGFGFRWRITDDVDFGAAGEFPISQREDLFGWRWTADFIWRPFGWNGLL